MVGIPVKVMLLLCIVVLTHATISLKTSHTSKTIHRADLPQQVVLSEKKLASIKAKLQLQFEVIFNNNCINYQHYSKVSKMCFDKLLFYPSDIGKCQWFTTLTPEYYGRSLCKSELNI